MFRGPAHVKEGFACSALGELRRTTVYKGHAFAIGVAVLVDDAKCYPCSHGAIIRVFDECGAVIETNECASNLPG